MCVIDAYLFLFHVTSPLSFPLSISFYLGCCSDVFSLIVAVLFNPSCSFYSMELLSLSLWKLNVFK